MGNISDTRKKANELRKSGNISEALPLYQELWPTTQDQYDGTGLLHCYRKLQAFDEALDLSAVIEEKFPDFNWGRIEIIWTNIEGVLCRISDKEPLVNVVSIAERLMKFEPEDIAAKIIIFKVLKYAKRDAKWNIVNEWIDKLDPEKLSQEPIIIDSTKKGWSDQALWYNFKINGLLEEEMPDVALGIVNDVIDRYPKQKKFFLRLKAQALYQLGRLSESEAMYKELCGGFKPDWWLLYEYAKVVRDQGNKDGALILMYKAADSCFKNESAVKLYYDIGTLCKNKEKYYEAYIHFMLCKLTREEKDWSVPGDINIRIDEVKRLGNIELGNKTLKDFIKDCKNEWQKDANSDNTYKVRTEKPDSAMSDHIGEIMPSDETKPFCFIKESDGNSYFCLKSDIAKNVPGQSKVKFDLISSFDKKKNEKSLRAINVRKIV